jgi:alanyl-tRNA synthetase
VLRSAYKQTKIKLAEQKAKVISQKPGNAVYLFEEFGYDELRAFANVAVENVGGILVALSDCGEVRNYVIASRAENLSAMIKEANAKLSGRGGGRPNMVQGSFSASLSEIADYFDTEIISL